MMKNGSQLIQKNAYIDGKWISAAKQFAVYNPADSSVIAEVADCNVDLIHKAIEAASVAQLQWRSMHVYKRAALLNRWYELILQHQDELALLLTSEQGKTLKEAYQEIQSGAAQLKWTIEQCRSLQGEILTPAEDGRQFHVHYEPIGVVAAITPWNYPFNLLLRKCAPALAVGCTIIAKPSEETPLIALALAKLAEMAEFPAGIFNVVTLKTPTLFGDVISQHAKVRCISFTGSNKIGKHLYQQSGATLKKIHLELGGNSPFIVTPTAHIDLAVEGLLRAKLRNCGQTCISANRIFIPDSLYKSFVEKLISKLQQVVIGRGEDHTTTLGPLINAKAIEKIETHIADAVAKGASILHGGRRDDLGSNFFMPTILENVNTDMLVMQEETFGPVFPLMRYHDLQQVIAIANDTPFGLAAYIYDEDTRYGKQISRELDFGLIGLNTSGFTHEPVPFGGTKESGLGRENGMLGIQAYLESKTICFQETEIIY